ncbi:hypothetical protein CHS0354_005565 [Potamilus streckersoni]|uniref:Uncharacterized protein n=1 Tax=Potamilus streckersoni TaxID=2493646 RepID=A0AAE0RP47_9BIVA|nr:hypothetical protein CHS0354_005565 [Potamilus streckersoni]
MGEIGEQSQTTHNDSVFCHMVNVSYVRNLERRLPKTTLGNCYVVLANRCIQHLPSSKTKARRDRRKTVIVIDFSRLTSILSERKGRSGIVCVRHQDRKERGGVELFAFVIKIVKEGEERNSLRSSSRS